MSAMNLLRDYLRWLSELALDLYACADEASLRARMLPAIHQRFRAMCSQIEEATADLSSYMNHAVLGEVRLPPEYLAALQDSPIARRVAEVFPEETLHLGQLVSNPTLERTSFFQAVLRPNALIDQLIGAIHPRPSALWAFGVNRDEPFSERERALFECVRVHARVALLRVRRSASGPDLRPLGEVRLRSDGRDGVIPLVIAPVLRSYFPGDTRVRAGRLPEGVVRWIESTRRSLRGIPPPLLQCWRCTGPRGQLILRLYPTGDEREVVVRFLEELIVPSVLDLQRRGLTVRECEVLHWLLRGKRDKEIALILGVAEGTATKHVERLREKTGSHTRAGAVAVANDWLRDARRYVL